jgi:hypothetical protein
MHILIYYYNNIIYIIRLLEMVSECLRYVAVLPEYEGAEFAHMGLHLFEEVPHQSVLPLQQYYLDLLPILIFIQVLNESIEVPLERLLLSLIKD